MSDPFLSKEDCREKLQAAISAAVARGSGVGVALTKDGNLRVTPSDRGCRSDGSEELGGVGPNCSYLDIVSVLEDALPLPTGVNFKLDSRHT